MVDDIEYPLTPEEWRIWLEINLKIGEEKGCDLTKQELYPLELLVELWNKEFSAERGYSPSFIPALTRNIQGFIEWVYLGHHEPNWSKSDSDRTS